MSSSNWPEGLDHELLTAGLNIMDAVCNSDRYAHSVFNNRTLVAKDPHWVDRCTLHSFARLTVYEFSRNAESYDDGLATLMRDPYASEVLAYALILNWIDVALAEVRHKAKLGARHG